MVIARKQVRRLVLDRIGVALSLLCATHCVLTPVLLLVAPTLGGWWGHPLADTLTATAILPIALVALGRGVSIHRRWSVLALGLVGLSLVVAGLAFKVTAALSPEVGAAVPACCAVNADTAQAALWPPALSTSSTVSVLGGVALALAHLANLRCCAGCRS